MASKKNKTLSPQPLLWILSLATAFELLLTVAAFCAPDFALRQFKLTPTPEMLFLANVLGWLFLVITLVCGLAWKWVRERNPAGWVLSQVLGAWWVGIGLGMAVCYQRYDHLLLDTFKGALILAFAQLSRPSKRAV